MTEMVWDDAGTRYFETGVSKAIFFDMNGVGVPWNGLVGVALDPQGGDAEHYWFDGVKYMDRVLAEDFQATVQAISTPKAFERCEGVREVQYGMKTHFNKRDKFNMVWRTEIGNDEGQSIAYKIHVAYNCLVQPSSRNYVTISDNTTPDVRTFVITATPACGRNSYFTFDSRDGDLSALEAQLYTGVLPKCWELAGLTGPGEGGTGVGPQLPDSNCPDLFEDLESYVNGQVVSDTVTGTNTEKAISGLINNGLDITELPAEGVFAANDSAASEVGTHPVLVDDDDATYISSADGDLGYTVGLPPLVGYVPGCALELHIRMSITGDVDPDDPDNIDADAQVHISTDNTGDLTIGGFSDGTDEGMGFALSAVDGTIVDYVVPLSMDAWVDTTVDDVVTALRTGAYLNVVAVSNNNPDTTPAVRVYEAKVVMLNDTESGKYLRAVDPAVDLCDIYEVIYAPSTTDPLEAAVTFSWDFNIFEAQFYADGGYRPGGLISTMIVAGTMFLCYELEETDLSVKWVDAGNPASPSAFFTPNLYKWYHVQIDWTWTSARCRVFEGDDRTTPVLDYTTTDSFTPLATIDAYAGFLGDADNPQYEVVLDNVKTQVHCHEDAPAGGDPIVIDLPAWNVDNNFIVSSDDLSSMADGSAVVVNGTNGHIGIEHYAETKVVGATQNIYLPATPAGYELTHATYVIRAMAASSETLVDPTEWSPDTPDPTQAPFLMIDSSATGWNATMDPIPVGSFGEVVWPGNDVYGVTHDIPTNRIWQQSYTDVDVTVSYAAVRLTYTAI